MEGGVYVCEWKRTPKGYQVWVKGETMLFGRGPTFDDARDALVDKICLYNGDGEAVLELDPPLPATQTEAKYTQPELMTIGSSATFEAAETASSLYAGPICSTCGGVTSGRSDKPLTVACLPPGVDGAFGHIGHALGHLYVFSENFISLLTDEERRRLVLRPVQLLAEAGKQADTRKFYELLGPGGPTAVSGQGLKASGWRCEACGYRTFGHWMDDPRIDGFVAAEDLPAPLPTVFSVGTLEVRLCTTAARWREMVGRNGTRGLTSCRMGVVPAGEVVRDVVLPTLDAARAKPMDGS